MSQAIRDALFTKLSADKTGASVWGLVNGRIYEGAAPQAADLPLLVYSVVADPIELAFGTVATQRVEVEFRIHGPLGQANPGDGSEDAQSVGAIESALYSLLHLTSLSPTGLDRGLVVCRTRGVPEVLDDSHVSRSTYLIEGTSFS